MNFIITVAIVAYLVIGFFISGFINVDPRDPGEFMPFAGVLLLWPVVIVGLVVIIAFGCPMLLGKKLGARYLERCEKFFDKIINGEVK